MATDNKKSLTEFEVFTASCEAAGIKLRDSSGKKLSRAFSNVIKKAVKAAYGSEKEVTFDAVWEIPDIRQDLIDSYDEFNDYSLKERQKKNEEQKAALEKANTEFVESVKRGVEQTDNGSSENSEEISNTQSGLNDSGSETESDKGQENTTHKPNTEKKANKKQESSSGKNTLSNAEKKSDEGQESKEPSSGEEGSVSFLSSYIGKPVDKEVNSSKYKNKTEVAREISRLKASRDLVQRANNTISFEGYSYHIMKGITNCYSETGKSFEGNDFKGIKEVIAAAVFKLAAEMEKSGDTDYVEAIKKELDEYNKRREEIDKKIQELEKIREQM